MTAEGLTPAAEADRRTLIRRATFDLWGLPPTPEEVEAFVADDAPRAYEDLVDRLLAGPRYGERWARHWLDLVRYAESDGFRQDAYRPDAWRYRDYVIRSFNDDTPYDQFVAAQLAGDELAPGDPEMRVATSFLRLWPYEFNQRDVPAQRAAILNDITDVTGDVFLGLGMGCARCHNHKFDPILQRDYYRLQAFFTPLLPRDDLPLATEAEEAALPREAPGLGGEDRRAPRADRRDRAALPRQGRPRRHRQVPGGDPGGPPQARRRAHAGRAADLRAGLPPDHRGAREGRRPDQGPGEDAPGRAPEGTGGVRPAAPQAAAPAMTVTDVGPTAPPTVIPGDRAQKEVAPGFLTLLDPEPATIAPVPTAPDSTGRRAALARWLTRPDHPLTTRVIVNRVWQYHFGRGLVATSSDFGRLGEPPSHPELLDWLATRFVADGWSLKALHRGS
jgi:hypothetical protein